MANIVGFLAARAAKAPWNVREEGVGPGTRGAGFASMPTAETHTWIQKAADLAGLGTSSIRWIPTDASLRMEVASLRRQLDADAAAGEIPSSSWAPLAPSAPARSIRCLRLRRCAQGLRHMVPCGRRIRRLCCSGAGGA